MGLATNTKQHDVTVENNADLFQAFALRSVKRNEAILRGRVATGTDTTPVKIQIGDKPAIGFFVDGSYPADITASCTLRAKGYEDITLNLTADGWIGVATQTIDD